ncbi:protein GVQW3-like [Octopus sinensis]|uniref:Protein GVQW3-like n=1 Tax=Octopus sinensis TaxID=2607531 RepID=A0A6P7S820_9MOLL|nr:protein GVQW3-like [Octopus sinensis]
MEETENRAVIKYLHLKGMTPSEIHKNMVRTLTDNAPSYATVKQLVNEFQRGRESVEDDPRPGRPPTATTEDNIDLALGMIMQDRRISCRWAAKRLGISTERADNIVTKELGFSKVSARWVPRLLTPEQKCARCTLSSSNLEVFETDEESFLARFITMDESWVHHYQPEIKEGQDLAPSDLHLFPKMKDTLAGRHFGSDNDVIDAVVSFLESQTKEFLYAEIMALQHRWRKCSAIEGDYVEK